MLRMVPVVDAVNIPFIANHVREGVFQPNDAMIVSAKTMLNGLLRVGTPLNPLHLNSVAQPVD
jgi:hypothetical protein